MAVTLDDLKRNPTPWSYGSADSTFALQYNIGGEDYYFIPESYISKGLRTDNTQRYSTAFLNRNNLSTLFNNGLLVDLEGVAPKGAINRLEKSNMSTKGVVASKNDLAQIGLINPQTNRFQNLKKYELGSGRNQGEIVGLTQIGNQFVYAQTPQGSRAGVTYSAADGNSYANYTYTRWGKLGEALEDVGKSVAGVPLLPEVIGLVTGSPAIYAGFKGLQTAGAGGDIKDVVTSGLKAYVASGGLEGANLTPTELKAIETLSASMGTDNPLEAFVKSYGFDALGDVLSDTDFAQLGGVEVANVLGPEATEWLSANSDALVGVGKDILINEKTPLDALTSQFGDKIVSGLGAESVNERAAAFAGLKSLVALDQGLEGEDVWLAAGQEYYERGGTLPVPEFQESLRDFDIDLPFDFDLGGLQGRLPNWNWPNVSIDGSLDIDPDLIGGFPDVNIPDINVDFPEISGELPDIGMDFPQGPDINVDLPQGPDINLDVEIPQLVKILQGLQQVRASEKEKEEERLGSFTEVGPFAEGLLALGQVESPQPTFGSRRFRTFT